MTHKYVTYHEALYGVEVDLPDPHYHAYCSGCANGPLFREEDDAALFCTAENASATWGDHGYRVISCQFTFCDTHSWRPEHATRRRTHTSVAPPSGGSEETAEPCDLRGRSSE